MSVAAEKLPVRLSVAEYLEGELKSEVRHEYFDGQVYAMAGATRRHNRAALYFAIRLEQHLKGGPCTVFMSDMKVRTSFVEKDLFYYPDVVVTCDPADTNRLYLDRPRFWLEVLSEDVNRDRVEKNLVAQRIESMEEFVLVSPDPGAPEIIALRRREDWNPEIVRSAEIELKSMGLTVSVDELYAELSTVPD